MKFFSNFKCILILLSVLLLTLSGCRAPALPEVSSSAAAEPSPDDIILTIDDQQVPYRIYRHYYDAAALALSSSSGSRKTEDQQEKMLAHTESLLLDDYVYLLLGSQLEIRLTEDELLAVRQSAAEAKKQQNLPDELDELFQFRLHARTLKNKIFITMYQNDFKQSAIHVQTLFIPYADQSDDEITSKKQLALLVSRLPGNDQSLEAQASALIENQNAVLDERYLTNGDMGEGTYQLAAGLATGQVSQPFTLGTDGVYLMQRLPADESYIDRHIDELLENSAEFSSLYALLTQAARQCAELTYADKDGLLSFLRSRS